MFEDPDALTSALQARRKAFAASSIGRPFSRNDQMQQAQQHSPFPKTTPKNNNNKATGGISNSNNSKNGSSVGGNHLNANYPMNLQQQMHLHQQQQQQQQLQSQFQQQQLQMQMLQQQQQFQQPLFQPQNYQNQNTAPISTLQEQHLHQMQQQQQFQMQGTTASPNTWPNEVQQQAGNNALAQEIGKAVALALASVNLSRINPDMAGSLAQATISSMNPPLNENISGLNNSQQNQQNLFMQQLQQQQQQNFQNRNLSNMDMLSSMSPQGQSIGSHSNGSSQLPLASPTNYLNDTTHSAFNTPYANHNTSMAGPLTTPSTSFKHFPLNSNYSHPPQQANDQLPYPNTPGLPTHQIEELAEMDVCDLFEGDFEMGGGPSIASGGKRTIRNTTAKKSTKTTATKKKNSPKADEENVEKRIGENEGKTRGRPKGSTKAAIQNRMQGESNSRSQNLSTSTPSGSKTSISSALTLAAVTLNGNSSTAATTPTPLSIAKPAATCSSAPSVAQSPSAASLAKTSGVPLQYPAGLPTSIIALVLEHQYQNKQAGVGQEETGLPFQAVVRGLEDKYSAELQAAEDREGCGVWKANVLEILQKSPAFTRHESDQPDAETGGNVIYYRINPEIQKRAAGIVGLGEIFGSTSEEAGKKRTVPASASSSSSSKQRRLNGQEESPVQNEFVPDNEADEEFMGTDGDPDFDHYADSEVWPCTSENDIQNETMHDGERYDHGKEASLQTPIGPRKGNLAKSISSAVKPTPLRSLRKRESATADKSAKVAATQFSYSSSPLQTSALAANASVTPKVSVQEHSRNRITIQPMPYAGTASPTVAADASKTTAGLETTPRAGVYKNAAVSEATTGFSTPASAAGDHATQPPPPKSALVRNPKLYQFPIGSETDDADLAASAMVNHHSATSPGTPIPNTDSSTVSDPNIPPSHEATPSIPTSHVNEGQFTKHQLTVVLMAQDRRIKVQQAQLQYAASCVSDLDTALKKYREREEFLIKWIVEREKKVRLSAGMVRTCWENGKRREEINTMRVLQDEQQHEENRDERGAVEQSTERDGIEIDEMWKWMNVLWKVVGVDDMDVPMDPEMEMEIKMREMKNSLSLPNEENDDESWTVEVMEVEVESLLVQPPGASAEKEMSLGDAEMGTEVRNENEEGIDDEEKNDKEKEKDVAETRRVQESEADVEIGAISNDNVEPSKIGDSQTS